MRTILPSLEGFSPRSAIRMARSIAAIWVGSNGWATSSVASATDRLASWFSGVGVP